MCITGAGGVGTGLERDRATDQSTTQEEAMLTSATGGISSLIQSSTAAEEKRKSGSNALLDEIREKGFANYAKEVQDKKLEELRKKILGEMGLSEEDLAKMDGDKRAAVEKMVAEEMRKRLAALNSDNTDGVDGTKKIADTSVVAGTPAAQSAAAAQAGAAPNAVTGGSGLGLDTALLQVLQEVQEQTAATQQETADRQKLPGDSRA